MSPLEAARTTLANYDAPRCGATFAHVFTDNSGCGIEAVARTCRRHAGHPTDGREGHSEFGDRVPGPDHLRAALAEVDRLTRTLACERGEWGPEGWVWNPDQRGYVRQQPRLWVCVRRFTHQRREGWGWDWEIEWRDSRAGGAGCRIDETRYRYGIEAIEAADAAIAGAS